MTDEKRKEFEKARERHKVLGECLTMTEAMKRRFSRNEAAQTAKDGYELAFAEENFRLGVLREMMLEQREIIDSCLREMGGAYR